MNDDFMSAEAEVSEKNTHEKVCMMWSMMDDLLHKLADRADDIDVVSVALVKKLAEFESLTDMMMYLTDMLNKFKKERILELDEEYVKVGGDKSLVDMLGNISEK